MIVKEDTVKIIEMIIVAIDKTINLTDKGPIDSARTIGRTDLLEIDPRPGPRINLGDKYDFWRFDRRG